MTASCFGAKYAIDRRRKGIDQRVAHVLEGHLAPAEVAHGGGVEDRHRDHHGVDVPEVGVVRRGDDHAEADHQREREEEQEEEHDVAPDGGLLREGEGDAEVGEHPEELGVHHGGEAPVQLVGRLAVGDRVVRPEEARLQEVVPEQIAPAPVPLGERVGLLEEVLDVQVDVVVGLVRDPLALADVARVAEHHLADLAPADRRLAALADGVQADRARDHERGDARAQAEAEAALGREEAREEEREEDGGEHVAARTWSARRGR